MHEKNISFMDYSPDDKVNFTWRCIPEAAFIISIFNLQEIAVETDGIWQLIVF